MTSVPDLGRREPASPPRQPAGEADRAIWGLALLLLLGALIRAWAALVSRFWFDEATFGLMGRHVLQGELPVFMYGQPFMGALEAYLLAPLFVAFGASVKALETLPLLLSLGIVALVFLLGRRCVGTRVGLVAAALSSRSRPRLSSGGATRRAPTTP